LIAILVASNAFAVDPNSPAKSENASANIYSYLSDDLFDKFETNLLVGINSKNSGLQTSCAYLLGEIKSSKAMIPLLRLATNGKTVEGRIIAGLSLYKIESDIGMYRLKWLAENDESELVRKVFKKVYMKYVSDHYSFEEL
jgi:hypothetical protein